MALIESEKLIHDLIQILHDDVAAPNGHLDPYYVFKTIKDQPDIATNLQPTCNYVATDCVSRQAAIDAVREAYENDEMFDGYEYRLEELPSVQPDQRSFSCGQENDMISRQDAIEAILAVTGNSSVRELYEHVQEHGLSDMWSGGVNAAIDIIIAVPPAQPERYTKEELRVFAHGISLRLLSQRSAQRLRYDEDTATEIEFLERLYDKVVADMRGEQDE